MIYFLCFMAGAFAAMIVIQQVEYRNGFCRGSVGRVSVEGELTPGSCLVSTMVRLGAEESRDAQDLQNTGA